MSQPNQHNGPKAVALKTETNAKLASAVQSPIRASDELRSELNQKLIKRMDRKAQVLGIIEAFTSELNDENLAITALQAALDALEPAKTVKPLELVQ